MGAGSRSGRALQGGLQLTRGFHIENETGRPVSSLDPRGELRGTSMQRRKISMPRGVRATSPRDRTHWGRPPYCRSGSFATKRGGTVATPLTNPPVQAAIGSLAGENDRQSPWRSADAIRLGIRASPTREGGAHDRCLGPRHPGDRHVWDPLRAALGRDDIVALSPPGFGAPVPDRWAATSDDYLAWLIGEIEALDGPVDLVGHDWGGGHVQRLAATRPDLIRSWVSDVAGIFDPTTSGMTWRRCGRHQARVRRPSRRGGRYPLASWQRTSSPSGFPKRRRARGAS